MICKLLRKSNNTDEGEHMNSTLHVIFFEICAISIFACLGNYSFMEQKNIFNSAIILE